jgi:predicted amidohydrolase
MENLRIALVQMEAKAGFTALNLNKIKTFVQDAAKHKADIICFPELAVQGYVREMAEELADDITGENISILRKLAQLNQMIILAGFIEKSDNKKPYITHIICYADGTMDKYRKTHLGKSELPFFSAGDELSVFKCKKANFAVEICWDLHFPEVSTILSLKGAEIIFAPHASPTIVGDRKQIWLKYLQARAYDNSIFLASCNLVGSNGIGSEFCGGCLVLDPKGHVIGEDFNNAESMLIVDLPQNQINKIRNETRNSMRNSFFLEYRRPELYSEIINKTGQ